MANQFYNDEQLRNRIRGAISKSDSLREALIDARRHISPQQIDWFVPWLFQFPELRKALVATSAAKDYRSFHIHKELPPLGFESELRWVAQLLLANVDQLSLFPPLRATVATEMMLGSDLSSAIDAIELLFKKSLWQIEITLFALQKKGGIELQKAFAREIQDSASESFAAFYAYYISERNEHSVSFDGFRSRVEKASKNWKISPEYLDYVRYKLLGDLPLRPSGLANILRFEQRSSFIDLYQTFLRIAFAAFRLNQRESKVSFGRIAQVIEPLLAIGDPALAKLHFWMVPSSRSATGQTMRDPGAESAFLQGNYLQAKALARKRIETVPSDTPALITYAKSCATEGTWSALDEKLAEIGIIGQHLFQVFARDESAESSANELAKLAVNLNGLLVFDAIAASVEYRISSSVDSAKAIRRALLSSPNLSPQEMQTRSDWTPAETATFEKLFPSSDVFTLERYIGSNAKDAVLDSSLVATDARHEAIAKRALRLGDWNIAIGQASALSHSEIAFFTYEGLQIQIRALLGAGRTAEALRLMEITCIKSTYLEQFLPFDEILAGKEWRDFKVHADCIEVPIAFDIYWKLRHQNEHLRARRLAWRMFMQKRRVRRPTDLLAKRVDKSDPLFIYFLENLCIPEVMDLSTAFSTVNEIDDERLKVCAALVELCPERRSIYDTEIVQISRRKNIDLGLKNIDSSRIYVDESSLAKSIERYYEEDFERYKEHKKGKIASSDADLLNALYELIQKAKTQGVDLPIPTSEPAERILYNLATVICQEFLQHPLYGLDRFLSMRVRHGSIDGHLRGALLDKHHLLTSFDEAMETYAPNVHWLSALSFRSLKEREWFSKRMGEFTQQFDAELDKFIEGKLQIESVDAPDGFLRIAVPNVWLASLRKILDPRWSIVEFADLILKAICYPQTKNCLVALRREIRSSLTGRLVKLINALQADVIRELDTDSARDLEHALNLAEYDLRQALDTVEKWFYFSQAETTGGETYNVDYAVDISLEATMAARRGFAPNLEKHIDSKANIVVSTSVLTWMTDALFIAFDNVYRHAKVAFKPTIRLRVSVVSDTYLCIRIESPIGTEAKGKRVEERLEEIRRAISTEDYLRYTRKEGNSGLIRLRSICFQTADLPHPVLFGFQGEDEFFVEVKYPINLLSVLAAPGG